MQIVDQPEELVARAEELDALPPSAMQLSELLTTGDWDLDEVERIIRYDQALTARLLQAANSALVGSAMEVVSVAGAIMQLGAGALLTLAMAQGVKRLYQRDASAYGIPEEVLWRHSVCNALAVDLARGYCRVKIPPEAFAAGLLHDVGKLVISRYGAPQALTEIRRGREQEGLADAEAEKRVLGFDHAYLGGIIAANWSLPVGIGHAVAAHHAAEVGNADDELGAHFVRLADSVAHVVETGLTPENAAKFDRPDTRLALGFERHDFGRLCQQTARELEGVLGLFE